MSILRRIGRALLYLTALTGLATFVFDDRSAFGRAVRRTGAIWIGLGLIYSLPGIRRTFGWQAEFRKSAWLLLSCAVLLWLVRWLVRRFPEEPTLADPMQAYSLVIDDPEGRHIAGGAHQIEGAACPNCRVPLIRLLTLDPSDARLHLAGNPVHLLFCFSCRIARGGVLSYRIDQPDRVTLLEWEPDYEPGTPVEPLPPRRAGLRKAAAAAEHQVGGKPEWLAEGLTCPSCNRPMPFLAVIGLGESQAVFHYCRTCAVTTAYHRLA